MLHKIEKLKYKLDNLAKRFILFNKQLSARLLDIPSHPQVCWGQGAGGEPDNC